MRQGDKHLAVRLEACLHASVEELARSAGVARSSACTQQRRNVTRIAHEERAFVLSGQGDIECRSIAASTPTASEAVWSVSAAAGAPREPRACSAALTHARCRRSSLVSDVLGATAIFALKPILLSMFPTTWPSSCPLPRASTSSKTHSTSRTSFAVMNSAEEQLAYNWVNSTSSPMPSGWRSKR
eukprot:scaffold95059_cov34-Tisochrysis_lutea.AAC.4